MTGNELHKNNAGRDIAGRDINNTYIQSKDKSPLRKVVEKLEADCLHDPDFNKYISDLAHYTNSVHPDSQRDLKTKLTEANRQDELHEAEELKEKFAKLLVKSSLSEQAQNAYVHVLSKIKFDYDHKVKPLLKEGATLAHQAMDDLLASLRTMIAMLHWRDFELLVELIFSHSGWQRVSVVGETMKTTDIELRLPITGERAMVQIKSQTTQAELEEYIAAFDRWEMQRLFYVYHTAKEPLTLSMPDTRLTPIGPDQLASLVLRAGLSEWVMEKAG